MRISELHTEQRESGILGNRGLSSTWRMIKREQAEARNARTPAHKRKKNRIGLSEEALQKLKSKVGQKHSPRKPRHKKGKTSGGRT